MSLYDRPSGKIQTYADRRAAEKRFMEHGPVNEPSGTTEQEKVPYQPIDNGSGSLTMTDHTRPKEKQ